MMHGHTIQTIPPKTLEQFAERARRMDGCVVVGSSNGRPVAWEFAQNSMVICLIDIGPRPMGHMGKDARRADAIRAELKARAAS